MKKRPMVILTGPTAVGKSALAVKLAKRINGSVISADSMQIYRYMDIGSAKITKEEMGGIPHALIDVLHPSEEFHVARFADLAREASEEIYRENKIPIVVGGTGFYIQALLYAIDFTEQECDQSYRIKLAVLAEKKGTAYLHEMLREVDPDSAAAIHPNNQKRIIRALEFYHQSGRRISEHNEKERQKESPYEFAYFVLSEERKELYERIEKRVDAMLAQGLIEEVLALKAMGCHRDMVSMQGLGYKEIMDYLDEKISLEEAVYRIKRDTRHFAKRQLTWFRRERDVIWLQKEAYGRDEEKILADMLRILEEKQIYIPNREQKEENVHL